ncbi:hypothetical protein EMIT093MI4_10632 [Pseudomonas sp. IT-93MI4]
MVLKLIACEGHLKMHKFLNFQDGFFWFLLSVQLFFCQWRIFLLLVVGIVSSVQWLSSQLIMLLSSRHLRCGSLW